MSQTELTITIGKSFEEIKRATIEVAESRGVAAEARDILNKLMRCHDELDIVTEALIAYRKSGNKHKLKGDLKRKLALKYNYSEKTIETIVYPHLKDVK